jgi:hypothetical protein
MPDLNNFRPMNTERTTSGTPLGRAGRLSVLDQRRRTVKLCDVQREPPPRSGDVRPVSERLIERGAERARLAAAVARACAGSGALTLVTGPPGIGKTCLVEAAGTRAREAGMLVLTGRGGELEHDQPYGVVRQLFERLLMDARGTTRNRV